MVINNSLRPLLSENTELKTPKKPKNIPTNIAKTDPIIYFTN